MAGLCFIVSVNNIHGSYLVVSSSTVFMCSFDLQPGTPLILPGPTPNEDIQIGIATFNRYCDGCEYTSGVPSPFTTMRMVRLSSATSARQCLIASFILALPTVVVCSAGSVYSFVTGTVAGSSIPSILLRPWLVQNLRDHPSNDMTDSFLGDAVDPNRTIGRINRQLWRTALVPTFLCGVRSSYHPTRASL